MEANVLHNNIRVDLGSRDACSKLTAISSHTVQTDDITSRASLLYRAPLSLRTVKFTTSDLRRLKFRTVQEKQHVINIQVKCFYFRKPCKTISVGQTPRTHLKSTYLTTGRKKMDQKDRTDIYLLDGDGRRGERRGTLFVESWKHVTLLPLLPPLKPP